MRWFITALFSVFSADDLSVDMHTERRQMLIKGETTGR